MAIEIVDLPSNSMVILDSYVSLPEGRYTMICWFAFVGPIEPQMNWPTSILDTFTLCYCVILSDMDKPIRKDSKWSIDGGFA